MLTFVLTHARTDERTERRKLYTPRHISYAGGIISLESNEHAQKKLKTTRPHRDETFYGRHMVLAPAVGKMNAFKRNDPWEQRTHSQNSLSLQFSAKVDFLVKLGDYLPSVSHPLKEGKKDNGTAIT